MFRTRARAPSARSFRVTEPSRTPALSLLFGYGAMVPLAFGAIASRWLLPEPARPIARDATIVWGGAILSFLAGVRRGLSFRTGGGPTASQIATMLWLFLLGLLALLMPRRPIAPVSLLLGYATLAARDPRDAETGEAPLFFARLRPPQMVIPLASLLLLLTRPAR